MRSERPAPTPSCRSPWPRRPDTSTGRGHRVCGRDRAHRSHRGDLPRQPAFAAVAHRGDAGRPPGASRHHRRHRLGTTPTRPPVENISSTARPSIRRSRPGSRLQATKDQAGSRPSRQRHDEPRAAGSELSYRRAGRTSTTSFERSETEHPPFVALRAYARPPRRRRRSRPSWQPAAAIRVPLVASFDTDVPGAPQPRLSSEARPSLFRSRRRSRGNQRLSVARNRASRDSVSSWVSTPRCSVSQGR